MHDHLLTDLKGWPDVESAPSVVRCFKQTVQIEVLGSITGNWDCLINTWPMLQNYDAQFYTRNIAPQGGNNSVSSFTDPANTAAVGGVTIYECASGDNMSIGSGSCVNFGALDSHTLGLSQEPGRLIGMGIEAVNTTSTLNVQGSVTVFRQPLPHSEPFLLDLPPTPPPTYNPATPYINHSVMATLYPNPPLNLAQAMLLAGSRQWKASEGAYVVVPFLGQDNPPLVTNYTQPFFIQGLLDTDTDTVNTTTLLGPQAITGGSSAQPTIWGGQRLNPVHMAGIYFSGLSQASTLSLNVNIYYETFPSTYSDLVTLAKPSCVYDSCALELLSRVLSDMAVGVPASENWDGEWWADVVSKLSSFLPQVGMVLGGPGGGALGTAGAGAGQALAAYLRSAGDTAGSNGKQKKQKQKQNKTQQGKPIKVVYETAPVRAKRQRQRKRKPTNSNMQTRVASF